MIFMIVFIVVILVVVLVDKVFQAKHVDQLDLACEKKERETVDSFEDIHEIVRNVHNTKPLDVEYKAVKENTNDLTD